MRARRRYRLHAARVAVIATVAIVALYAVCAVALDAFVTHRLTTQADARLSSVLANVTRLSLGSSTSGSDADADDAPIFVWRVAPDGTPTAFGVGAPALPRRRWSDTPTALSIGGVPFRFEAVRDGGTWLVAGQDVADIGRVHSAVVPAEIGVGALLALIAFLGALVVGLRASAPLEILRRRQAEFTADASHELRTPLSVVEAEVDLALRARRDAAHYEEVLRRIQGESARLRRIVDDLMWLARADAGGDRRGTEETCDVAAVARSCAGRFDAVAARRGIDLEFRRRGEGAALVKATPEWIDRLVGVLVDNACKYGAEGGRAGVEVVTTAGRVVLRVDDSGPGIPPAERSAVFDRFHRATTSSGGAGLGLAIADSVVRRTGGTWSVGASPWGGARMEVGWRRAAGRDEPPGDRARAVADRSRADPVGAPEAG